MGKFFSILVPHYNEPVEVIKPLLDSIAIQQNIDMNEIEVVICDDGPEAVLLPDELLKSYPYDIQYHREPKGGVSQMRNQAFNYSNGEYVAWCDCDDQFYHVLAFWFIKRETTTPMQVMVNNVPTTVNGFDALYSVFLEEGRNPQTGETYFIDRKDGFQFVHGKVFKRSFIVNNNIHFFPECVIHEDNVLNAQVQACTQNIKWCPAPFYLWKWRDNSVCRRDPMYIKKTYPDLIKSSDCLIGWLVNKSKFDRARECIVGITMDAYYTFCHPSWKTIETQEYRDGAEKKFSEYFKKWEYLWNEAPDQMKMAISSGIRQRSVQQGMEMETETLEQFLERIRKLS
jgi:glycosyltransferase involved in cell wall biosynthesis